MTTIEHERIQSQQKSPALMIEEIAKTEVMTIQATPPKTNLPKTSDLISTASRNRTVICVAAGRKNCQTGTRDHLLKHDTLTRKRTFSETYNSESLMKKKEGRLRQQTHK
ncbi:hypothetical protein NPIL_91721 [Nephila pilipes]|uniref:Uncharacterized protein n=1 Tax=Nephila pilipes TaxID=299642 RepID=A0A8X6TN12_NEPPI|nr:hypothetical protein NPIL_91721 [Nephila pilipes]